MKKEQPLSTTLKLSAGALLLALMGLTYANGAPTEDADMKTVKPAAGIQFDNASFYGADGKFDVEKLVDLSKHNYEKGGGVEPNLTFTPDNKWIVFRANMQGALHVYAVEIAKAKL